MAGDREILRHSELQTYTSQESERIAQGGRVLISTSRNEA